MKKIKSNKLTAVILTMVMVLGMSAAFPAPVHAAAATGPDGLNVWYFNNELEDGSGTYGSGTWSWKQSTKTLTLTNIKLTSTAKVVLQIQNYITIRLIGTNVLNSTYTGSSFDFCSGIWAGEKLTINGSGSLTVTGGSGSFDSYGIRTEEDLTIGGNATVNSTGGNASGGYDSHGIYLNSKNLTIGDNATVTATGGRAEDIVNSIGIRVSGNFIIGGNATVIAAGDKLSANSYGINTYQGSLTINSGTVTATGTYSAFSEDYTIPKGYKYWTNTSASAAGATGPLTGDGTTTGINSIYKYVKIQNVTTNDDKKNPAAKASAVKTLPAVYIVKGKSVTLPAAVQPYNAANKNVTFKSKNKKIAKVTSTGKVKGLKTGKTTITITTKDGNKKATCKVYVVKKAVKLKKLNLNQKANVTLTKGKTLEVKAKLSPKKTTGIEPKFTSGNTSVAVIDKAGTITALKAGTTTITVKAGKLKKTIKLTVN